MDLMKFIFAFFLGLCAIFNVDFSTIKQSDCIQNAQANHETLSKVTQIVYKQWRELLSLESN